MQFKYRAKKDGQVVEGVLDVRDRFDAYRTIKAQGMKLVSIKRAEPHVWNFEYWNEKLSTVPDHEIILFADNLATMISAGLSLSRALEVAQKQTQNPKFKRTLAKVAQSIQAGDSLQEALMKNKGVFSDLFISMVGAGELSGNLPGALKSVGTQLNRVYSLKKKIKGAMIYPAIIIMAVIGVGIFMMVSVVPTLAKTFKEMNADLPMSTKIVMGLSDFMQQHFIIFAVLSGIIFISTILFLKTRRGKWFMSKTLITIPIIKELTKELNSAYAARTLSSLLKSGVDIVQSAQIASNVTQNLYFRKSLRDVADMLQKGKTFTEAVRKYENLYPIMFVELMAVGEETGSVTDMMEKVANYYEEEVNDKTKNMSKIIEPFLMLFIGIAVGFFAVSMVTPMYSITEHI